VSARCEPYLAIVQKYDWDVRTVMAIMEAESHCSPQSANMSDVHSSCVGSYSLLQVGCFWYPFFGESDLFDPEVNIDIAYKVYKRSNSFNPWTTYTSGKFKKYIKP